MAALNTLSIGLLAVAAVVRSAPLATSDRAKSLIAAVAAFAHTWAWFFALSLLIPSPTRLLSGFPGALSDIATFAMAIVANLPWYFVLRAAQQGRVSPDREWRLMRIAFGWCITVTVAYSLTFPHPFTTAP
ncbi:MAG: hypothetical protein ACF8QF_02140 [Phycisphaerales bacterium]